MSDSSSDRVHRYYEVNTKRFVRFGQTRTQNIHRTVWGKGVQTAEEASDYVNHRILEVLYSMQMSDSGGRGGGSGLQHEAAERWLAQSGIDDPEPLNILDLGCGVGSSVFYLAERFDAPASFYGITISETQVEWARRLWQERGQKHRCTFQVRDFHNLDGLHTFHLAYAVEAFLHATEPTRFLNSVAERLHTGGLLILCDDFLTARGQKAAAGSEDRHYLETFKRGWVVGRFLTVEQVTKLADDARLKMVHDEDFTLHLELRRPRDRVISLMVGLFGWLMKRSTYLNSLVGGDALQQCLIRGLVQYRFLIFQKK
jgi:SAM-dependent methyltransferase